MKSPTDVLRDEHRVILKGLATLEAAAARLASGEELPERSWSALVDWFRMFADRTHHAKEEDVLFPAMVKAGAPSEGGPIDVMLEEHVQGRALLQALATGDRARRVAAAREYVELLRDHIDKEHGIVFPLAEAVLDGAAARAVASAFDRVQAERGKDAILEYAEAVVDGVGAGLLAPAVR